MKYISSQSFALNLYEVGDIEGDIRLGVTESRGEVYLITRVWNTRHGHTRDEQPTSQTATLIRGLVLDAVGENEKE